jgi:cytochrome c
MLNEEIKNATDKKQNDEDVKINMDLIDPILDKIIEYGYDSLTEEEKIILKKYKTDNDTEN